MLDLTGNALPHLLLDIIVPCLRYVPPPPAKGGKPMALG
jgi:hypothetical protein